MNKRLKELRKSLGMSQEAFGKIMMISKAGVADLESGRRNITEKHLALLEKYPDAKINVEWLRTGEGEMFLPMNKEEQVRRFVDAILTDKNDSFKRRMIFYLVELSEENWEVLEKALGNLKKS